MTDASLQSSTQQEASDTVDWARRINTAIIPMAVALVVLVIADAPSTLRLWLTIIVFLLGPGSGLAQFFHFRDASLQVGTLIGISAAINILLAQSLLWMHHVSGLAAVCVVAGLTMIRPMRRNEPRGST